MDELFHAALDRPPEERQSFLQRACGGDSSLLADVESLLRSDTPSAAHTFEEWAGVAAAARIQDLLAESARRSQALIGRALSHYDVVDRIGSGGMGDVYLGRDRALGRHVAIKILPREVAEDPHRLGRFVAPHRSSTDVAGARWRRSGRANHH